MIVRRMLQIASWLALAGTILPSIAFLAGTVPLDGAKWIMLLAMIAWFIVTPLWMGREHSRPSLSTEE